VNITKTEPAVLIGFVISLVIAALLLFTDTDVNEFVGILTALSPFIAGVFIRQNVYSPATVEELVHPDVPPPPPGH